MRSRLRLHVAGQRVRRTLRTCWFTGHRTYVLFPDVCQWCGKPVREGEW